MTQVLIARFEQREYPLLVAEWILAAAQESGQANTAPLALERMQLHQAGRPPHMTADSARVGRSRRRAEPLPPTSRRSAGRLIQALVAVFGLALIPLAALGCGGEPARSPQNLRALDERRALQLIAGVVREQGERPAGKRMVEIAEGKPLEVDVGAAGRKYGIAYTTPAERAKLGEALPTRDASMGDALLLARGAGDEADARILVLEDTSYLFDDHVGTDHETTAITAENQLKRDVRDFLVRAKAEKWP